MAITKEAAIKSLFNDGWEQKDIADILKISEVTVSKHVTKSNLRQKRTNQSLAKKTSEENALMALEHQSTIIRLISEKLRDELATKDSPSIDDLKAALIPKGEIDALQKMFTTIKGKELDWTAKVRIMREFSTFLKERDLELAKDIVEHIHAFINEIRKDG